MSILPDHNKRYRPAPAPDMNPAEGAIFATLGLTPREAEVLHWIAEGKRDREIASIVGVSVRTAQHHVSHILEKLNVETRTAAARIGLELSARSATSADVSHQRAGQI